MIEANIRRIQNEIGREVTLVVVTKNRTAEEIKEVWNCGLRDFGENRVQALLERKNDCPPDIRWHLIGHLQTNKVKQILPFIHMIQSVDSTKLIDEISKHAKQLNLQINCLFQLKISSEESKSGLTPDALDEILNKGWHQKEGIIWRGLMGIAELSDDQNLVQSQFRFLRSRFDAIRQLHFKNSESFDTVSMGMSSDYSLALKEGSNMLRIGSLIFA